MIGGLAARPARGGFGKLVLIGPSARYIDDKGYVGGSVPSRSKNCSSFSNPKR